MFPLLRKPNTLGRTLTWNLPAGKSCPGAGKCREFCYARKGCFVFSSVTKAHKANLWLSRQNFFPTTAINWLWKRTKTPEYIRLHSSGDVYSQAYLSKLTQIATFNPKIKFYLYTKSLHLNWKEFDELPNTARVVSMGGKHDSLAFSDPQHHMCPVCVVADDDKHLEWLLSVGYVDGTDDDGVAACGTNPCIVLRKH